MRQVSSICPGGRRHPFIAIVVVASLASAACRGGEKAPANQRPSSGASSAATAQPAAVDPERSAATKVRVVECPSAVVSAVTQVVSDPDSTDKIMVTISASEPAAIDAIRRSVARRLESLVQIAAGTADLEPRCPVFGAPSARLSALEIDGGSRVVVEVPRVERAEFFHEIQTRIAYPRGEANDSPGSAGTPMSPGEGDSGVGGQAGGNQM